MNITSEEDKKRLFESITCKKCATVFDTGEHKPCNLTCGHSLCHACIGKITAENKPLQCPQDGKLCQLSLTPSGEIPTNFDLLKLVNFYSSQSQRSAIQVIKRPLQSMPNKYNVRVSLYRNTNSERYGFYYNRIDLKDKSIVFIVGEVRPFSIAFNCGLRNDDWIIEANSVAIKKDLKGQEFQKLIYKYKTELHLVVTRGSEYKYDGYNQLEKVAKNAVKEKEKVLETVYRIVEARPKASEYGFTVITEKGAFLLTKVEKGSPFDFGRLKVGEKIVEVNGFDVVNMSYNDFISLINKAKRRLILGVKEPF